MLDTFYLPKEAPNLVNYPVLRAQQANMNVLMTYALRVSSALTDYNEARYDKIDLNMDELQSNIQLCRDTCYALGTDVSVPFDVLIDLRKFQEQFQNIAYLYRTQGKAVIGTPSNSASTSTTPTSMLGGGI
jgi:hypothetical protein